MRMSDSAVTWAFIGLGALFVLGLLTVLAFMYLAGMAHNRFQHHRLRDRLDVAERRLAGYRKVAIHLAQLAKAAGVDAVELERVAHMVAVAEEAAPVVSAGRHSRLKGGEPSA